MKIYIWSIVLVLLNLTIGYGQVKKTVRGSRLVLELPDEFKEDREAPGFVSELDSSNIIVLEMENPYSFEELVQKRIANSLTLGLDTSYLEKFMYDGYNAVKFKVYYPHLHQNGITINFGSDSFLVDISVVAPDHRLKELEKIVMQGKYDKSISLDEDGLLGFTVSYKGTRHAVHKKDANTLNTLEMDPFGNVVSWLNLSRMPKGFFDGLSAEKSIDMTYELYHFNKSCVGTDSMTVDRSKLLWKIYREYHGAFQEYNIIGVMLRKDFDLLVMGGGGTKGKLDELYDIIKTIRFKDSR